MENLRIVREVAAVTCGQDMPFFEASEGVFNSDPAASEFGIAGRFRSTIVPILPLKSALLAALFALSLVKLLPRPP